MPKQKLPRDSIATSRKRCVIRREGGTCKSFLIPKHFISIFLYKTARFMISQSTGYVVRSCLSCLGLRKYQRNQLWDYGATIVYTNLSRTKYECIESETLHSTTSRTDGHDPKTWSTARLQKVSTDQGVVTSSALFLNITPLRLPVKYAPLGNS